MVKIQNELKEPVRIRDTYQRRDGNPDYSDYVDAENTISPFSRCFSEDQYGHIALIHLPRRPGIISCPNCLNCVKPRSRKRILPWTHYLALALTPVLCCCLPYFLPFTQGKVHYCPYCKTNLGVSDICEPRAPKKPTWYIDFESLETGANPESLPICSDLYRNY